MLERPWYLCFNYPLALTAIALGIFGLVIIKSATLHSADGSGDLIRQTAYLVIGVVAMLGLAFIDYHLWQRWALPVYIVNILILGAVAVAGHSALGAQRWIGVGPIVFQPSEPAKLLTILSIAALLADPKRNYRRLRELWVPVAAIVPPTLLVLKQPDLGTALIFVVILTAMLFFALPNLWHFAVYAVGLAAVGAFAILTKFVLKDYQRERLLAFLHPEADPQGAGWSLMQSKIAIGSGQLTGKGLYQGTQTQLGFVPEHATDFIFTVVGEELGFHRRDPLARVLCGAAWTFDALGGRRARPLRVVRGCRHCVHVALPGAHQRGHDGRHHADHRHPFAFRFLRRVEPYYVLSGHRCAAEYPSAALQDAALGTLAGQLRPAAANTEAGRSPVPKPHR